MRRRGAVSSYPVICPTGHAHDPLYLAECDHQSAKYAVLNWHYSRAMPSASHRYGVWESGRYVGCVLYGVGAAPLLANSVGVERGECLELVRVALDTHTTPVSRIVAVSLRLLKRKCPAVRVVVSFADSGQGHIGGIYQAGGWLYLGASRHSWVGVGGKLTHPRTLVSKYGTQALGWLRANVDADAAHVPMPPKHKYALAFCPIVRADLIARTKPYPAPVV